ncbi:hypothetical protein GCM10011591_14250 [Nocardia camponoti]|uniref:non-specific serine/threonine protein kinase n=1 Tax=Nocardia camponoti TaxID=1616106 RepID=A0A917QCG6_9NOCA|nr:hypothetical protein GCM10011591_14250 [Nocardia camponoti]
MEAPGSRTGSRFGPYELRSLLGKGGMGEVYEALDTGKDRVVALKLLAPELAQDPAYQVRFRRESQAAAKLAEPHIIPIHDWGVIDGVLFIDMRLVPGTDLRAVLASGGPLSPARTVAVIEQVAAALDAAHADGLVHRDVKPANILLTPADFAYLADFGIARSEGDTAITQTGVAMGSYSYMAPERFDVGPVTHRADIYSLACVLHELLTGAAPFAANSMSVLIRAHLSTPPPRPSAVGVPASFDAVVARGMAKDPADRFASAGALASAAREALRGASADGVGGLSAPARSANYRGGGDNSAVRQEGAASSRVPEVVPGASDVDQVTNEAARASAARNQWGNDRGANDGGGVSNSGERGRNGGPLSPAEELAARNRAAAEAARAAGAPGSAEELAARNRAAAEAPGRATPVGKRAPEAEAPTPTGEFRVVGAVTATGGVETSRSVSQPTGAQPTLIIRPPAGATGSVDSTGVHMIPVDGSGEVAVPAVIQPTGPTEVRAADFEFTPLPPADAPLVPEPAPAYTPDQGLPPIRPFPDAHLYDNAPGAPVGPPTGALPAPAFAADVARAAQVGPPTGSYPVPAFDGSPGSLPAPAFAADVARAAQGGPSTGSFPTPAFAGGVGDNAAGAFPGSDSAQGRPAGASTGPYPAAGGSARGEDPRGTQGVGRSTGAHPMPGFGGEPTGPQSGPVRSAAGPAGDFPGGADRSGSAGFGPAQSAYGPVPPRNAGESGDPGRGPEPRRGASATPNPGVPQGNSGYDYVGPPTEQYVAPTAGFGGDDDDDDDDDDNARFAQGGYGSTPDERRAAPTKGFSGEHPEVNPFGPYAAEGVDRRADVPAPYSGEHPLASGAAFSRGQSGDTSDRAPYGDQSSSGAAPYGSEDSASASNSAPYGDEFPSRTPGYVPQGTGSAGVRPGQSGGADYAQGAPLNAGNSGEQPFSAGGLNQRDPRANSLRASSNDAERSGYSGEQPYAHPADSTRVYPNDPVPGADDPQRYQATQHYPTGRGGDGGRGPEYLPQTNPDGPATQYLPPAGADEAARRASGWQAQGEAGPATEYLPSAGQGDAAGPATQYLPPAGNADPTRRAANFAGQDRVGHGYVGPATEYMQSAANEDAEGPATQYLPPTGNADPTRRPADFAGRGGAGQGAASPATEFLPPTGNADPTRRPADHPGRGGAGQGEAGPATEFLPPAGQADPTRRADFPAQGRSSDFPLQNPDPQRSAPTQHYGGNYPDLGGASARGFSGQHSVPQQPQPYDDRAAYANYGEPEADNYGDHAYGDRRYAEAPYPEHPYGQGQWENPDGYYEQPKRSLVLPILVGALAVVVVAILALIGWRMFNGSENNTSETAATPSLIPATTAPRATTTAAPRTTTAAPVTLPAGAQPCESGSSAGALSRVAVGTTVTSCGFAEAVRAAYAAGGVSSAPRPVVASSPVTGRSYTMMCTPDGKLVTCVGGENAVVYVY